MTGFYKINEFSLIGLARKVGPVEPVLTLHVVGLEVEVDLQPFLSVGENDTVVHIHP